MGKRCRVAALGATFALVVAACAATEAPRSTQAAKRADRDAATVVSTIPESLAKADAPQPDVQCVVEEPATIAVVDSSTGVTRWTLSLTHDVEGILIDGQTALVSLGWASTNSPGLTAVDLDGGVVLWERTLSEPPQSVTPTEHGLILVGRDGVRSLDPVTGEDRWVTSSEFDYVEVEVSDDLAFAVDTVALHAIDLVNGALLWQLPIDRADELAVRDTLLVVASGSSVIAVDIEIQGILWEQTVNRSGAGRLHIGTGVVAADLSPAAAPVGGVVALDRVTGRELWSIDSIDDVIWVDPDLFVTSRVPENSAPGVPFEVVAIDSTTGEQLWTVAATAPARRSIVGTSARQIIVADPHPGVAGIQRIRALDTVTGVVLWETTTTTQIDGALIDLGVFTTLYRVGDPSALSFVSGNRTVWEAEVPAIAIEPSLSPAGLVIVADGITERCVGRQIAEPTSA